MKKLTTLFILCFLAIGLFAEPKVPITNNYLKSKKSNSTDDCLIFVNNSCQNVYRILAEITDHSTLWISNESLITNTEIIFSISFSNQKEMEDFINIYVDSYNLENVFIRIRNIILNSEIIPLIIENEDKKISEVLYMVSY